jgi:hypothetical protein
MSVMLLLATAIYTHDLDSTERATSLETIFTPSTSFFALGTAYIEEGKNEVEKGRVLLFGEDSGGGKTRLIGEIPLAGCVYAISGLGGEGLVASVNSRVRLSLLISIRRSLFLERTG